MAEDRLPTARRDITFVQREGGRGKDHDQTPRKRKGNDNHCVPSCVPVPWAQYVQWFLEDVSPTTGPVEGTKSPLGGWLGHVGGREGGRGTKREDVEEREGEELEK